MPQSLKQDAMRTQPNGLRERLDAIRPSSDKSQTDPNRSRETAERVMLALINRTRIAVGMSQKAMAITAGCSESELADAINGRERRRFDAEWLWRQDDVFLAKFIELLQEERRLTPENVSKVRRERLVELFGLLLEIAS